MKIWENTTLGNLSTIIRNGFSGTQVENITDFPVSRIETISDSNFDFNKIGYVKIIDESYRLLKGDILLSNINSIKHIGKVAYFDSPQLLYHGMNLLIIRLNSGNDSKFIFYYLVKHKAWFERMASQAINQASINQSTIKYFPLSIPKDKYEQTAIAHVLSTVDKAIEQTEKLIAKYKRIKTGLMQDLLTKGIDENGNIRSEKTHKFKNSPLGKIPVEWGVVSLEDKRYFELATGGTPSTSKKEYWDNGTIPWLSSGEVHNKIIKDTVAKITPIGLENSNARFYPIGSILIALAGQGKTRGTVAITEIETTSNQSIAAIVPNQDLFISSFLYHQLDYRYEELRSISSGSGRAGLSLRILRTIQVIYADIFEQKEIINKLNQIDNFLSNNYISLSKLSLLKSGLMQDLLTGKVRVPEELIEEINKLKIED